MSLRGAGSASASRCPQRGFSVKVDEGHGNLRVGRVNGRSLKLISGCFDLTGAELLSTTSAYTYFGLWQSDVAQAEVLLHANGISHSQGIYRIVESVPGILNDAEGNSFVVRRNSDESVSIEEPDVIESPQVASAIRAPYEELISFPTDSPTLRTDVEARLDLEQYLWFVAANTRVMLGDYIDETFFYDVTNPVQPALPYLRIHSWDMDDIWTECHNPDGPFATYPLLFCGETVIEEYIRANDAIRARYEEILRSTMNLLPPEPYVQHFNAVLDDVARRLTAAGTRAAEVQFDRGSQRHSTTAEAIAFAADNARAIFDTQNSWYYDLATNLPANGLTGMSVTTDASPFLVAAADWVISAGTTVHVEAGVSLVVGANRFVRIADGATLVLAGTAAKPIYVYGAAGRFGGIAVGAGATLNMTHVVVRGAQSGIVAAGAASVRIDNCRVDDAGGTALQLDATSVSVNDVQVGLSPSHPDVIDSLTPTTASLVVAGASVATLELSRFVAQHPLTVGPGLSSVSLHQVVLPRDAPAASITISSTAAATVVLGFDIVVDGANVRLSLSNSDVNSVATQAGATVGVAHSIVRGQMPPSAGVANSILAAAPSAGAAFDVGNVLLASVSLVDSCPATAAAHATLAAAFTATLPAAASAFFVGGAASDGDARGSSPHLLAGPVGGSPGSGVCHSCELQRPALPQCTSGHQCAPHAPALSSLPVAPAGAATVGPASSYLPFVLIDSFAPGPSTITIVDDARFPWPAFWLDGTARRSISVNQAVVQPDVELLVALPLASADTPLLSSFSSNSLATFTISLIRHADASAEELVARFVRDLNDGAGRASLAEIHIGGVHRGVGLVRATPLAESDGVGHGDRLHVRVADDAASLTIVQRSLTASAPFSIGDSGAVATATIERLDASPLGALGDVWRLLRVRSFARLAASLWLLHASCESSRSLVLESVLEDGVLSVAGVVPGSASDSLFAQTPDLTSCTDATHPLRWVQRLLTTSSSFQAEVHMAFDDAAMSDWSHSDLLSQAAAVEQDVSPTRSWHAGVLAGSSWPTCSTGTATGTVLAAQRAAVSAFLTLTLSSTTSSPPSSIAAAVGLVVGTRWFTLSQLSEGRTIHALLNLPVTLHAVAPVGWRASIGDGGVATLATSAGRSHAFSVQADPAAVGVDSLVACDGLRFSELSPRTTGPGVPEWFELANDGLAERSLAGLSIVGDVAFAFGADASLGPGERLVIASSAAAFRQSFGFLPFGEFAGKLTVGSGERVLVLVDVMSGQTVASAAWTQGTIDKTRTLVPGPRSASLCHVSEWRASSSPGGSPGVATLLIPLASPSAQLPVTSVSSTFEGTVSVPAGWTVLSLRVLVQVNEGTAVSAASLAAATPEVQLARLPESAVVDVDVDGTIGLFGPQAQPAVFFGNTAAQTVGQSTAARLAAGLATPLEGALTVTVVPSTSPTPFLLDIAVEVEALPTGSVYPPTLTSLPGWPTFSTTGGPNRGNGSGEGGESPSDSVDGGMIGGVVAAIVVLCCLLGGCLFVRQRNGARYAQSSRDARLGAMPASNVRPSPGRHSGRGSRRSSYVSSGVSRSAAPSMPVGPPPPPPGHKPASTMQVPSAHPYAMTDATWSVPQQPGGSIYEQTSSRYAPQGTFRPGPPAPPKRAVPPRPPPGNTYHL